MFWDVLLVVQTLGLCSMQKFALDRLTAYKNQKEYLQQNHPELLKLKDQKNKENCRKELYLIYKS